MVTLDSVAGIVNPTVGGGCNDIGLLWLDCEGSELSAIQGGYDFIETSISMINVEMTGKPRGPNWPRPIEIHRALTGLGFLQVWVHTIRTCIGQFDAVYLRKELFKPDLCACPGSVDLFEKGT